jgi:hypothetical protein
MRKRGAKFVPVREALESDAGTLAASAEQRPAAYRFVLRDGKIDVLSEAPEPEDREFALDTYRQGAGGFGRY